MYDIFLHKAGVEMAKSSRQKQKILHILNMLMKETDEEHGLTVPQIISRLQDMGISAERKSVYDDLDALDVFLAGSGYEITRIKTNTVTYHMSDRMFELAELKLLVDSVQSSKFITPTKTGKLIKKVESLVSTHEAAQLHRQVYVTNRVKNPDEAIYYAVDDIHRAISQDKKITFSYLEWTLTTGNEKIVKTPRHNGKLYHVSPWALTWDDENYYLVAFDEDVRDIRHYRVDKMKRVQILDESRDGRELFDEFDMAQYSKSVFGMFGGKTTDVRLRFDNSMIGVVADRFGKDIFVRSDGDSHFIVDVKVALSPQFFGWLFGLYDKVEVISPKAAVESYKEELSKVLAKYQ